LSDRARTNYKNYSERYVTIKYRNILTRCEYKNNVVCGINDWTRDMSGWVRLFLILTKNKFLTEILRAIDEKHLIIYKNQEYF